MMMVESYYKPIKKDLEYYFYQLYWKDILEALKDEKYIYNAVSILLSAIRKGSIHYEQGVFSGKFNASISRELSKFATYDGRSKTWKGIPPSSISSAATIANDKGKALVARISSLIEEIPSRVAAEVDTLKYSLDAPLFAMNKAADKDISSLGLSIEITPSLDEKLKREYTNNQNINIKNWTPNQIVKLRDMVQRNTLSGFNRLELIQMISSEYEVSMTKASFLARQETSLLLSSIRNERYEDAGIEIYKWSTSNDIKVVGNPSGLYPKGTPGHGNHYVMQGKFCKLSDPTVYADNISDARNGVWKSKLNIGADNTHPGQAWNDRCVAIPVII